MGKSRQTRFILKALWAGVGMAMGYLAAQNGQNPVATFGLFLVGVMISEFLLGTGEE